MTTYRSREVSTTVEGLPAPAVGVARNIGKSFAKLTIVGTGHTGKKVGSVKVARRYECLCECGSIAYVTIGSLQSGNTKSCGCLLYSAGGLGDTAEYKVWKEMLRRCENPNHRRYSEWGGRGNTVCPERQNFDVFIGDMGLRPSDKHSIERLDNDAGYCRENCVWATRKQQANNQSSNRLLTLNGRTQTMTMWAEELGVNYCTLRSRKNNLGWTDEKALMTPFRSTGVSQ